MQTRAPVVVTMDSLHDLDGLEWPEEIEDIDHLHTLQSRRDDRLNRLLAEVQRLDKLVIDAQERSREANEDLERVDEDLGRVHECVDVIEATMPNQQQEKFGKIRDIISYGISEGTGGRRGVKINTGEATAASGASRNTALRLMDEIGANFEWASVENQGGPHPKQLKIATNEWGADAIMDDLRAHYTDGGDTPE